MPQESLRPIASAARSRYANHRISNSSKPMNKIVFVEDDAEVGNLIAAYLGKHDIDVLVEPRGDMA